MNKGGNTMKLRANTLWKVPVFCIVCGFVCMFLTIYIGGYFFREKTVMEDGITKISINATRSAIWSGFLFVAGLLAGGLWAFRSMTKAEIAVSAAIITAAYFLLYALQLAGISMLYMGFTSWITNLYTVLHQLTKQAQLSQWLSCLSPLLFIPFGRKTVS